MFPYVGTLGWRNTDYANGAYRQFTMNNALDKYVTVKNTGKSDAYVRTIFAFEMGEYTTIDEFDYKIIGMSRNMENGASFDSAWVWGDKFVAEIYGENYLVVSAVYTEKLAAGDTTEPSLLQVYMNKDVTQEMAAKVDGNDNGKYEIFAFSQAVQAAGFADAQTALDTAFGKIDAENLDNLPWVCNALVNVDTDLAKVFAETDPDENGVLTIGINGNVEWETDAYISTNPFKVKDSVKEIVITGTPGSVFTATGYGIDPVGHDTIPVTFKNITIVDESKSYAENNWEYGYLEFRGDVTFVNCDIQCAVMLQGINAEFINCTLNSNKDSEYAAWVLDGSASFTDCSFTGARGIKVHAAYNRDYSSGANGEQANGTPHEVSAVVVDNCSFVLSAKPGLAIGTGVTANTTVTITNSVFNTQSGEQNLYIYECDVADTSFITENNNIIN